MLLSDEYLIMRKGWQGGSPPQGGEITEDWWQCLLPVICANVFHLFSRVSKIIYGVRETKSAFGDRYERPGGAETSETFGDEVKRRCRGAAGVVQKFN